MLNQLYFLFCGLAITGISSSVVQQPLTDDELRILKIVLVEHLDELNKKELSLDLAISGELKVTKRMIVECLNLIGQIHISKILDKKQGNDINLYSKLVSTRHAHTLKVAGKKKLLHSVGSVNFQPIN